jgi:hypothetical protein
VGGRPCPAGICQQPHCSPNLCILRTWQKVEGLKLCSWCVRYWCTLRILNLLLWYLTFFFFLVVLGFELRALHLLYHLSHTPNLFFPILGYFPDRISCFCPRLAWTAIHSPIASYVAGITGMTHCAWPGTIIFDILLLIFTPVCPSWLADTFHPPSPSYATSHLFACQPLSDRLCRSVIK